MITKYSTDDLFKALLKGLTIEISIRRDDVLIEEYLSSFKFFRITGNMIVLADKNNQLYAKKFEHYNTVFIGENDKRIIIVKGVKLYKYLFPFMTFTSDEYGLKQSKWYDINLLLTKLPTRKNIIRDLLADL